jgi:hypothetical protein
VRYPYTEAQILEKVRLYAADRTNFGRMSTGERIAVALVLDRQDLMQVAWGTMAESVYRLGNEWAEAALQVQREGRAQCEEWALPGRRRPRPMGRSGKKNSMSRSTDRDE